MPGISPEDSGSLDKGMSKQMSDVAMANSLIEVIGGKRRVGEMFYSAVKELNKRFPHKEDPQNKWTERRLRGWWNKESEIVKHFQMMELYETAEQVRRARQDHAEYIEKTARLRAMAKLRAETRSGDVGA
jgi:hypothetical protein